MKKLVSLLVVVVALGFVACEMATDSSSDDNTIVHKTPPEGELVHTVTADSFTLDGLLWMPDDGTAKTGVILQPGTGGTYTTTMFTTDLGPWFAGKGYAVLSMDRRDKGTLYTQYRFSESNLDQKYMIDFLEQYGVEEVILLGYSYSTICITDYYRLTGDKRVKTLIQLAPLGDTRWATTSWNSGYDAKWATALADAYQMQADGNGENTIDARNVSYGGIYKANVLLDRRGYESKAIGYELTAAIENTGLPILCIKDELDVAWATLDPAKQLLIDSNENLDYILLPAVQGKGGHGFTGKMEEVKGHIETWLADHNFGAR